MGILTEQVRLVVDGQLGFVATVCPDGTPNLSPKGTIAVWDDDHVVFAHIHSPATVSNLVANPAIEINVVDQLSRKGFRLKGTATVHVTGRLFETGIQFYDNRGTTSARERIKAIVIVAVERVTPVLSPAYDLGASEQELRAYWRRHLLDEPTS